jgi:coenzyme PQQ biosynthesis protein PqqD
VIDPQMRPALAPKARLRKDSRSGGYLLLYPERGMELNRTAVEIVRLCDGQSTVREIVESLARRHASTPSDVIESEVLSFLGALQERALLARDDRP